MISTNIVGVQFDSSNKIYHYKNFIEDVRVGDLVVVPANDTYEVVEVVSMPSSSEYANKYVVCKLDIGKYYEELKKVTRQEKLKEELDKRMLELQSINVYEKYAQIDDTIKTLYEEYKSIV